MESVFEGYLYDDDYSDHTPFTLSDEVFGTDYDFRSEEDKGLIIEEVAILPLDD